MWRTLFTIFLILHGLIHLMGFSKAFHFAEISQLTQPISKPSGLLWLLATMLLIMTAIAFALQKDWWWQVSFVAILVSQVAIFTSWQNARFGTIANIILLFITIISFLGWSFFRSYERDLRQNNNRAISLADPIAKHPTAENRTSGFCKD
jgi:hypothetical protein